MAEGSPISLKPKREVEACSSPSSRRSFTAADWVVDMSESDESDEDEDASLATLLRE